MAPALSAAGPLGQTRVPRVDRQSSRGRDVRPSAVVTGPSGRRADDGASGPPRRDETFSRADRLLHRAEFERVLRRGARMEGPHVVTYVSHAQSGRSRLGMTVSRRVGPSVARNRLRRRLRETFRRRVRPWLEEQGHRVDVVVRALPGATECGVTELERELLAALSAWASRTRGRRAKTETP